jgi:hypothetical protein
MHDGSNAHIINGGTGDLNFKNDASNKDIYFSGVDGSSNVTALTLDMSEGGNATFAGDVVNAHEIITAGNQSGNNNGSGADGRYAIGVLDLSHSGTPSNYRIETNIPFNSGGADFSVVIEGFRYGGRDPVSLQICWHIYPANTPYNHCVISNGGWSPVIKLARNTTTNNTTIYIEAPGYWPKMFVRSVHSSNYEIGAYAKGWTWSDATLASGYDIITTVLYTPMSLGGGGIINGGGINGNTITGTTLTSTGHVNVNGGQILTPAGVNLALNPNTGVVSVGGSIQATGNIQHTGLTMTTGTDIDQVKDFAMSFALTKDVWTDTGINATDLSSGTYVVQMHVQDYAVGGGHYNEFYSGMMSWYSGDTNDPNVDEILLHRAGHAPQGASIQLRTERTYTADTNDLMLQIKHNITYSAALDDSNTKFIRFKFRRLI